MNCIFCKQESDKSKSIEHILPESLGNKKHFLKKGIVCDSCNNYFATKIEKIILEKPYFKNVRYRNSIRTKRGRLVPDKALFPYKSGGWINLWLDEKGFILDSKDTHIVNQIKNRIFNKLIIPAIPEPEKNDSDISRFLAKIGLEFLIYKIPNDNDWINEILNKKELDPLRNYARYGNGQFWPYHQRRIYSEEAIFIDIVHHPEPYEILHEFDLLYTEELEMYFVMTIMGIEFSINLGGREMDGYFKWLENNNNISPIRRYSEIMIKDKPI
jgi:hypothetical protein